jgi:hypothetical protein
MRNPIGCLAVALAAGALACGGEKEAAAPQPSATAGAQPSAGAEAASAATPAELPKGLLLALSQFQVENGKVLPKPGPARLEILLRQGGTWRVKTLDDPESNVFHKALVLAPKTGAPGILTLGGTAAALKLWRASGAGFTAETLWKEDFGGRFSRMRDAELADFDGDGSPDLAVATHDQGIVAVLRQGADGAWSVQKLDQEKDTFVHEIEVGDLDGDGALEIYATPSEPNRLDGTPQSGKVTRYAPAKGGAREVAVDLGDRHAKEILVSDVDGDGKTELYVSVEGVTSGKGPDTKLEQPVSIRRYAAGDTTGVEIASLEDHLCRFLTVGDFDGDGRREMVAAAFKAGLWLLRPGAGAWQKESIDRASSGFEHASLAADLDGDGVDELYVASDDQGELRRYVWTGGRFEKEVIHRRTPAASAFTWNLTPVPVELTGD